MSFDVFRIRILEINFRLKTHFIKKKSNKTLYFQRHARSNWEYVYGKKIKQIDKEYFGEKKNVQ